jgi:hypothetical protein
LFGIFKKFTKIYLKSLAILEKASIALEKSSKIIEILIIAPYFLIEASVSLDINLKKLPLLCKCLLKVSHF